MAEESPTIIVVPNKPLADVQDAEILEINDSAAAQWTSGEYRRISTADVRRFLAAEEAANEAKKQVEDGDAREEASPEIMQVELHPGHPLLVQTGTSGVVDTAQEVHETAGGYEMAAAMQWSTMAEKGEASGEDALDPIDPELARLRADALASMQSGSKGAIPKTKGAQKSYEEKFMDGAFAVPTKRSSRKQTERNESLDTRANRSTSVGSRDSGKRSGDRSRSARRSGEGAEARARSQPVSRECKAQRATAKSLDDSDHASSTEIAPRTQPMRRVKHATDTQSAITKALKSLDMRECQVKLEKMKPGALTGEVPENLPEQGEMAPVEPQQLAEAAIAPPPTEPAQVSEKQMERPNPPVANPLPGIASMAISDEVAEKPSYTRNRRGGRQVRESQTCFVCGKAHVAWQCPELKQWTLETRAKFIYAEGRCSNCFFKHPVAKCNRPPGCKPCNGMHSPLLCVRTQSAKPRPNALPPLVMPRNQSNQAGAAVAVGGPTRPAEVNIRAQRVASPPQRQERRYNHARNQVSDHRYLGKDDSNNIRRRSRQRCHDRMRLSSSSGEYRRGHRHSTDSDRSNRKKSASRCCRHQRRHDRRSTDQKHRRRRSGSRRRRSPTPHRRTSPKDRRSGYRRNYSTSSDSSRR